MRERRKEPRKGSEIEPEIVCVQGVGASLSGDGVLFVERSSELFAAASLSHLTLSVVKASLNRANSSSQ